VGCKNKSDTINSKAKNQTKIIQKIPAQRMVNTAKHINKESVLTELVLVKQALQLTVVLYKSSDVLKITKEI
jgi:hypothetical protein